MDGDDEDKTAVDADLMDDDSPDFASDEETDML